MEFAYGIPGSVGGAVVMNAGAYGGEVSQVLTSTLYFAIDGEVRELNAESHEYGYRTSYFKKYPQAVALCSKFHLHRGDRDEIGAKMEELYSRRQEKQPLEYPSAGSIFKRRQASMRARSSSNAA